MKVETNLHLCLHAKTTIFKSSENLQEPQRVFQRVIRELTPLGVTPFKNTEYLSQVTIRRIWLLRISNHNIQFFKNCKKSHYLALEVWFEARRT